MKGLLIAWDPVKQQAAWQIEHKNAWNGGVLSTAANLLFQGNGEGKLVAYRADTGSELWSFYAQTGIVAAPMTYSVKGEQYVAVLAGWGGTLPLVQGGAVTEAANRNVSRVLAFKLGGRGALPILPATHCGLPIKAPSFPLPDRSFAVSPSPSSKGRYNTSPCIGSAKLELKMTRYKIADTQKNFRNFTDILPTYFLENDPEDHKI